MKNRLDTLLEKYWDGETSLAEERELRQLIQQSDGHEKEKELFAALGQFRSLEPQNLNFPQAKTKKLRTQWLGWAASAAILIGSYWGWQAYEQNQVEREAYEEVMQALALIQTNLAKGQEQLQPLNELKYLNTTNQLFQLNTDN